MAFALSFLGLVMALEAVYVYSVDGHEIDKVHAYIVAHTPGGSLLQVEGYSQRSQFLLS